MLVCTLPALLGLSGLFSGLFPGLGSGGAQAIPVAGPRVPALARSEGHGSAARGATEERAWGSAAAEGKAAEDATAGDRTAVQDPGLDYTFSAPLLGGFGLSQLAELRGKPVLVEFWGTY